MSAANDPLIDLVRLVDGEARVLRKVSEEQSEAKQQAHTAISRARNTVLGTTWDFAFSDKQGRATSAHSAAILEALNKVYGAKELAHELVNAGRHR